MADIISFKQAVYTNDPLIYGNPTLVPGTIGYSASAALEGVGTPIVGLINPGSYTVGLSTEGVAFNYTAGLSGLARTGTRVITLSSNGLGVNTTFTTRISSAFTVGAFYSDHSSAIYAITADSGMSATRPLSASRARSTDAVDPNVRRLVQLGYH